MNASKFAEVCHALILVVLFGAILALLLGTSGCGANTAPVTLDRYEVRVEGSPVDVPPDVTVDVDASAFGVLNLRTRLIYQPDVESVAVCQTIRFGKVMGSFCAVCNWGSPEDARGCEIGGYPAGMADEFE